MKPYYEDDRVRLYHGDWRELIDPDLRADLILTDPPYGETTLDWDRWPKDYGTWPRAGFVLDHICERRARVNVAHLRELTNEQNIRRSVPNYGIGGSQRVV